MLDRVIVPDGDETEFSIYSEPEILKRCHRAGILSLWYRLQDVLDGINRWHLQSKPSIRLTESTDPHDPFRYWGGVMEILRRNFLAVTGAYDPKAGWRPGRYSQQEINTLLKGIREVSVRDPDGLPFFSGSSASSMRHVSLIGYGLGSLRLTIYGDELAPGPERDTSAWSHQISKGAFLLIRYAERRYQGDYTRPVFECRHCGRLFIVQRVKIRENVLTGKPEVTPRACSDRCRQALLRAAAGKKGRHRVHNGPKR